MVQQLVSRQFLKKTYISMQVDLILWEICAFYRENEDPNQQTVNILLKEIQEVEQIKNDALCTERRVLGKLL